MKRKHSPEKKCILILHYFFVFIVKFPIVISINNDNFHRQAIIGGNEAGEGRYSFLASIVRGNKHRCGGTIIAQDLVLTAAHCSDDITKIDIGKYTLDTDDGSYESFIVEEVLQHPLYDDKDDVTRFDFAIMKLYGKSNYSPVKLNFVDSVPKDGETLTVAGWGATDRTTPNILSNVLNHADVTYMSNEKCSTKSRSAKGKASVEFSEFLEESMLCAYSKGKDSCQGDSGGPLVDKHGVQVGIVSFGFSCASDYPGVYSRVSDQIEWISETVCSLSTSPPDEYNCAPITSSFPAKQWTEIIVKIELDFYPEEVGWLLESTTDNHIYTYVPLGAYRGKMNTNVTSSVALDANKAYRFVFLDEDSSFPFLGKYTVYKNDKEGNTILFSGTVATEYTFTLSSPPTYSPIVHTTKGPVISPRIGTSAPSVSGMERTKQEPKHTSTDPTSSPFQDPSLIPLVFPTHSPSKSQIDSKIKSHTNTSLPPTTNLTLNPTNVSAPPINVTAAALNRTTPLSVNITSSANQNHYFDISLNIVVFLTIASATMYSMFY